MDEKFVNERDSEKIIQILEMKNSINQIKTQWKASSID
jgi:hypothetical protein